MEASRVNNRSAWGGIFLSIIWNIHPGDLFITLVLAAVGTTVSYFVSSLLGKLFKKNKV